MHDFSSLFHVAFRHGHDTTHALDGFDHHTGDASAGVLPDGFADLFHILIRALAEKGTVLIGTDDAVETGRGRCGLTADGKAAGAHGDPVEPVIGITQVQQVEIAAVGTRHHERQVQGLRTAVDELHDPVLTGGQMIHQFLGILGRHLVEQQGSDMLDPIQLLPDEFLGHRMARTDADAHVLAGAVEVLFSVRIVQIGAFTTADDHRVVRRHAEALERRRHVGTPQGDDGFAIKIRHGGKTGNIHGILLFIVGLPRFRSRRQCP